MKGVLGEGWGSWGWVVPRAIGSLERSSGEDEPEQGKGTMRSGGGEKGECTANIGIQAPAPTSI